MKMTNRWNRFIYRLWAPVYDSTVGHFFLQGRTRAIEGPNLQPDERVLLVGVGTGADLALLPQGVQAVGIDISGDMLAKARQKLPLPGREVTLLQGDAQQLLVDEAASDVVVFDKLLPDTGYLSLGRRLLNLGSMLFGTDITRRFGDLGRGLNIQIVHAEPFLLQGTYRVISLAC